MLLLHLMHYQFGMLLPNLILHIINLFFFFLSFQFKTCDLAVTCLD